MHETRSFRLARPAISILALTLSLLTTSARAQECCLIGGRKLTARQAGYVHTLASSIAQELPGSRAEKATTLAYVTWWALREGLLNLKQPHLFSSCTTSLASGCCTDIHVELLDTCKPLPATVTPKSCPAQHNKNERPCSVHDLLLARGPLDWLPRCTPLPKAWMCWLSKVPRRAGKPARVPASKTISVFPRGFPGWNSPAEPSFRRRSSGRTSPSHARLPHSSAAIRHTKSNWTAEDIIAVVASLWPPGLNIESWTYPI